MGEEKKFFFYFFTLGISFSNFVEFGVVGIGSREFLRWVVAGGFCFYFSVFIFLYFGRGVFSSK